MLCYSMVLAVAIGCCVENFFRVERVSIAVIAELLVCLSWSSVINASCTGSQNHWRKHDNHVYCFHLTWHRYCLSWAICNCTWQGVQRPPAQWTPSFYNGNTKGPDHTWAVWKRSLCPSGDDKAAWDRAWSISSGEGLWPDIHSHLQAWSLQCAAAL